MQVAYQRILQLTYVDDLLAAIKALFIKLFEPFLTTFVASLHAIKNGRITARDAPKSWNLAKAFEGWNGIFDKLLKGFEDKAAQVCLFSRITLSYLAHVKHAGTEVSLQNSVCSSV